MEALQDPSPQRAMQEVVREAVSDPGAIEAALGTPTTAGIETVHRSDELTILNVVWAPRMAIYPHDHGTWAVIGIYGGREDNSFFKRRKAGPGLDLVNGRSLADRDTMTLGRDVVHAVTNPLRQYTGAIHVYAGDFFTISRREWDSPEAAEQPYSVEHTMKTFADANEKAKAILAQG